MKKALIVFVFLLQSGYVFGFVNKISQEWDPAPPKEETRSCKLFTGTANTDLAKAVAKVLGVELGKALVSRFNDGEVRVQMQETIRDCDVYLMQSICPTKKNSVNDSVMELFLMSRACKRGSARSITAIIPYYGYARQDRKTQSGVPISAADMALLLETAGVDHVVAIDLHSGQIQGFFRSIPVDNLYGCVIFVPYFAHKDLVSPVVVSPDAGGVERAKNFIDGLKFYGIESNMAMMIKERSIPGQVDKMHFVGNVENCDAIIVDDICDSGGTLVKAAEQLKKAGARRVFASITHGVFSGDALEKIKNSCIEELVVADTIPLEKDKPENITQVSVASLLGEAIKRIQNGKSTSYLFRY